MKKFLFLFLAFFFFFLVIFQTSFLNHFSLWGVLPNFILIFLILLNFLENSRENSGLVLAGFSGFLLDFFSGLQFGVCFLTFIFLALLIKKFLKSLGEENVVYFALVLIVSLIFYNLVSFALNSIFKLSFVFYFNLSKFDFFEIAYNLAVGVAIFGLISYVRKYF
ncbi:MAG: rod shape-determining protein MreD [Candidatus Nealsonbacteria bacterium]|nr:rod shape-determining protein MreD [Candidatus Nealsonbacteria bacterium]